MKFKTNLVIGAVFALLLAFVYFYEIKGGQERRQEAERSKQLLAFKESEVKRLVLVRTDGEIEIERSGAQWRLLVPVDDGADAEAVERYLRNIAESEREKVVVDSAEAQSAEVAGRYGLADPRLKVLLETESGLLDTLFFGSDAPTDRYTYVQKSGANPEIFVVRAWRFDNLDKGVFDLRDRRVLALAKGDAVEAQRSGNAPLALRKEDAQWRLQAPVAARASNEAVDGLLGKIESSEVESFVDEAPDAEALADYGLVDGDALQWSLRVGPDRAEKRLSIGRADAEGRYYARDASRPQVFLVDSTLVQKLLIDVHGLRDKKPLQFDRDAIDRIELRRSGQRAFAADRDTSGTWRLGEPASEEAKSWKLSALLTDLQNVEAVDFALAQGGDAHISVHLLAAGAPMHTVRFYVRDGDVFLEQDGDENAYRIDGDAFADFDLQLDDVRQAPAPVPVDSTRSDE